MSDDGWISVEDALPMDSRDVLTWDGDGLEMGHYGQSSGHWWRHSCAGHFVDVTHWMPFRLPLSRPAGGPAASDA